MIIRYVWFLLIFIPALGTYNETALWISESVFAEQPNSFTISGTIFSAFLSAILTLTIAYPVVARFVFKNERISIRQYSIFLISGLGSLIISYGPTLYLLFMGYIHLIEFLVIFVPLASGLILLSARYLVFGRPAS